jgi:hypothetical protein
VSRPALGPTQPPIQWVTGTFSVGVKRSGRGADHSLPFSAEVKNAWTYTSTPQYAFTAWCSVKAQGQLYLYLYRYEGVSKSFQTGRLERELQMVQFSATRCICIAILWVGLVSFAAIALCVASQRVFIIIIIIIIIIISLSTQVGKFWTCSRTAYTLNFLAMNHALLHSCIINF